VPNDGPQNRRGPRWLPARDEPIAEVPARRRLVVLLICSSSLFITYLDSTILNVALPTIQEDLRASLSGLQWVADSYLLVLASVMLLTGSAADRLGRKRVFTFRRAGLAGRVPDYVRAGADGSARSFRRRGRPRPT
jgi:hypothetical protein